VGLVGGFCRMGPQQTLVVKVVTVGVVTAALLIFAFKAPSPLVLLGE